MTDASGIQDVAEELRRVLPALIAEARQRGGAAGQPANEAGWHAYAPIGSDEAPFQPPSPWGSVELVDVTATGPLVIVTFRWLETGSVFAHATDLSDWLGEELELAPMKIEHRIARLLASSSFPGRANSLVVGKVTVITGDEA